MAERLTLIGTAEQIRAEIGRLAKAGVTHVRLYIGIVEPYPLLNPQVRA